MKTHDEFLVEARRIESIGKLYAQEHRRIALADGTVPPQVIPTFLTAPLFPRERWMEVAMIDGALEYRLLESVSGIEAEGSAQPVVIVASDSAFDVLAEADELEKAEKLEESLTPILVRIERGECDELLEPAVLQHVEEVIEAGEPDAAAKLETKADIVQLLTGEIEPIRFVAAVVEGRASRLTYRESFTRRCEERRIINEP
jgi:hypothetical protein